MSQPDVLASKRPGFRLGRVAVTFKGSMSLWKKGRRIKIWRDKNGSYTVEKVKWTGSLVPLANACYGVARRLLEFDCKAGDYCEVPMRETFRTNNMRIFTPCGRRAIARQRGECRCKLHFKP